MPTTFTVHEAAAGVWACVAPGTAGPAVSNAAIIDLGDKTLVVDTFQTVLAARELAEEAQVRTGREPMLVVNSHWHSDHVYGNQVFADNPIVGTRRMLELMIDDAPTRESYDSYVEYLRRAADENDDIDTAAGTRALADALEAGADTFRLTLPDFLIGDRLEIAGERSATILGYGKGHTESDLFVHLPDGDVIVAGDLLWTGMHPKTDDGFPAEWAIVLDRMAELRPSAVVPGHGPPGTAADVLAMAAYMRELERIVDAARRGDVDPETVDPPAGSDDWQGTSRFRNSLARLAGD